VRQLAREADVLIENFKPGTLEGWGLGWDTLHELNPRLIMLRISGYGQTGPYRHKPGFGVLGEAMGGLRHLTGEPSRVPVRVGVSIGDTLSALHGVIGLLTALYHRDARGGTGQVIDVALYESVFNVMESLVPEYDAFGAVRERSGSALPGIAPTNAYRCADGKYVLIAGNGDSIFKRLMVAIGRVDLEADPGLAQNDGRVSRADEIDATIEAWTLQRTLDGALDVLEKANVPAGRIYSVEDIVHDPQYRPRNDRAGPDRRRRVAQGPRRRPEIERHARPRRASGAAARGAHRRSHRGTRLATAQGVVRCRQARTSRSPSTKSRHATVSRWSAASSIPTTTTVRLNDLCQARDQALVRAAGRFCLVPT
jgi:crotonobetainyl-CoA:carnitine CoA-transferase CaiB-like acyl-CoA transferase